MHTHMRLFQRLSLLIFLVYLAVLPGSTVLVALDRVPAWGDWMGGALLIAEGAAVLCWLLGRHGRRGALAALLVFLIACGFEHVGVTTGFPFGRYHYTEMLQPQLLGVVPLAITSAWLMVAIGAWQLATANVQTFKRSNVQTFVAATLVLLLDLQIETVATKVNRYWVWLDGGAYYGVPTANFIAWWLVGLGMALVVARVLGDGSSIAGADRKSQVTGRMPQISIGLRPATCNLQPMSRIPANLYLLSTLMFAIINLAHGYIVAGMVGVGVLLAVALTLIPTSVIRIAFPGVEKAERAE